ARMSWLIRTHLARPAFFGGTVVGAVKASGSSGASGSTSPENSVTFFISSIQRLREKEGSAEDPAPEVRSAAQSGERNIRRRTHTGMANLPESSCPPDTAQLKSTSPTREKTKT